MTFNDRFAYIPLFAIAAMALVLMVLLIISKKRSTARVSFVIFAADIIVIIASIIAGSMFVSGNGSGTAMAFYGCALAVAIFLVVPYGIMLSTFEPKKIDKLVPKSYNERNA